MPKNSFTASFLRGAAPGLGRLAQAVGGGKDHYQDAFDKEGLRQSRIGQAIAAQQASQAKAAQDKAETSIIQGRPQVFDRTVSARAGVSIPQVQAYKQFQDTGFMPERELPGPVDEGGIGPGSAPVLDEATMGKIGQLIGQLAPSLLGNVKDNKPDDLARADQIYGDMGLRDQVLGGQRTAADVGEAQRAIKGGDLFKQSSSGSVINPLTGTVDQSSPIAEATVALKGAQAAKAARPPAPKAGSNAAVDRDQVAILSQELFNAREAMKTATGPALARLQGDEAAVVAELKRAGVKDVGQLAIPKPGKAGAGVGGMKIPAEVQRMNVALRSLDEGLNSYESLLKEFNPRNPAQQLDPETRAKAASLVADLRLQLKEAQALGALTGPDVAILDRALSDPATLRGAFYGRGGLTAQLTQTREALKRRKSAIEAEFKLTPAQPNGATPPSDIPSITSDEEFMALPSGATFRTPDGHVRRKP